jgi:lysophospholipase L1-like esterase
MATKDLKAFTNAEIDTTNFGRKDEIAALKLKVAELEDNPGGGTGKLDALLLSRLEGKYVSILGDSISSYQGTYPNGESVSVWYPTGDIDSVDKMWWKIICDKIGMNWLVNNSISGSRLTSGAPGSVLDYNRHRSLHTAEREPDIIFVEIGGNDIFQISNLGNYNASNDPEFAAVMENVDVTSLRGAYGKMLYEMRTRYLNATIFCCTLPYNYTLTMNNPNFHFSLNEFNNIVRSMASAYACNVLEWGKSVITIESDSIYLPYLGHPNALGMQAMADESIPRLIANDPGGSGTGTMDEPVVEDEYSCRVRGANGALSWKNLFQRGADSTPAIYGKIEAGTNGGTTLKAYAPYYLKDNAPLKGKYFTKMTYVSGEGVLTVGYKNIDSVASGDASSTTMDGWLFRITPNGNYGLSTYLLDGTDTRVELNTAELVNGAVYLPPSGRILCFQDYAASGNGGISTTTDKNTAFSVFATYQDKVYELPSPKYLSVEFTIQDEYGGDYFANPALRALEDRIKALEAKVG